MSQIVKDAYAELIRRVKEASLLRSCADVLGWDEQTYMPPAGSALRGDQMGLLARMTHEMATSPIVGELLNQLESSDVVKTTDSVEAANIREIRRSFDRAVKLPKALVEELARVSIAAQQAWRQARKDSNFTGFQPWLEKVVALKREEAQAVGKSGGGVPYDALLDEYEPGATTADITRVFAELRRELVPLVASIAASGKTPRREILHREFPVDRQRFFAESAAAAIGFDFHAGRLDVTTHPFCSGFGPGDCRITTRYNPKFFNEAFFGVLHEAGHGLYEQGLDAAHFGTPSGSYASLGIHESQSRLWENQVGRGGPFWDHFFPRARQVFPSLQDVSRADFLWAINDVRPSYIRVEADEATYNMHIILRFELEQALIGGGLKPGDVPSAWNEKFVASFGLKVQDDAHGCLQDVHWAMGGIGYFPTYTLGNLFAAQFMEQARKDLPGLEDDFRRGEFGRLKGWLNEKVHHPGRRYTPGQLCQRVTGRPLEHAPLVNYLRGKYSALYGIN
jgi:carboxypeptidase Taq